MGENPKDGYGFPMAIDPDIQKYIDALKKQEQRQQIEQIQLISEALKKKRLWEEMKVSPEAVKRRAIKEATRKKLSVITNPFPQPRTVPQERPKAKPKKK